MTTTSTPNNQFGGQFYSNGGPQILGSTISGSYISVGPKPDYSRPATICELPASLLSPSFKGRDLELQYIDRAFSTQSQDLPARCVIYGPPGQGKTQLALRFATLHKSQYPYVYWMSAASGKELSQGFSKLAYLLRLPGGDTLTLIKAARAWLEDSNAGRSYLIVLDNVTKETAAKLCGMLPRSNGGGRLLFTTRTAKIAEGLTAPGAPSLLALPPLTV